MESKHLSAEHFLIAAKDAEIGTLSQLQGTLKWVNQICDLIHHLQRERGLSNVYLASKMERLSAEREEAIAESNACIEALYRLITPTQSLILSGAMNTKLMTSLSLAVLGLSHVGELRNKVGEGILKPTESTLGYNRMVGYLLSVIFEAADLSTDPEMTRELTALFSLIQAKEYAGQERAWTAIGFANGRFSRDICERLVAVLDSQARYVKTFLELADPQISELWEQLAQSDVEQAIISLRRMRDQLCGGGEIDPSLSEVWYEQATLRIDEFRAIEIRSTEVIAQRCQSKIEAAKTAKTRETARMAVMSQNNQNILLSGSTIEEPVHSLSSDGLSHTLYDLISDQQHQIRELTESLSQSRAALVERKQVERAKEILRKSFSIDEEKAYRQLQQSAMNQNRSLVEVAEQVIETYQKNLKPAKNRTK